MKAWPLLITVLLGLVLAACKAPVAPTPLATPAVAPTVPSAQSRTLRVLVGSELEVMKPLIEEFNKLGKGTVAAEYMGSVDLMLRMQDRTQVNYDAVLAASLLWMNLGNTQNLIKNEASIARTPTVFAVKKAKAQELALIGKTNVTVNDLLGLIRSGKIRYVTPSPSQTDPGATAYMGTLNAFANRAPDAFRSEDLANPQIQQNVKDFFGAVERSGSNASQLATDFAANPNLDAMINYESLVIGVNKTLIASGKDPLYVTYLVDGMAMADVPLGYVERGNKQAEEIYNEFRSYLLSKAVQDRLLSLGWRTGLLGTNPAGADAATFNPDWGISLQRVDAIKPITLPKREVTQEAIQLFQTQFRRSSYTIYILDTSGSMEIKDALVGGQNMARIDALKRAMAIMLDQNTAARYNLQASPNDITVVIPFTGGIVTGWNEKDWSVNGNSPDAYGALLQRVNRLPPSGGTNMYTPTLEALNIFQRGVGDRIPAIVILTDGHSTDNYSSVETEYRTKRHQIPIYSIYFGEADKGQLQKLADLSRGSPFDGRGDLAATFRLVRGQN